MVKKIILVDDKPVYREAMRILLNKIHPVEIIGEASNGEEFLELLKQKTPDIVFIDIEMPGINGIEATKRAIEKFPDLIIIGLSMYENPNYIESLISAGARGYLLKLSDNFEICKTILEYPTNEIFFSREIKERNNNNKSLKKTILVVEDFENTRFIIEFALQQFGYLVINASDGYEAFKLLDGRKIDLIITDYNMPRMDGIDLANKARKIECYKKIPILILTSEINLEKQHRAEQAEITAWIKKPFKMDNFLNTIKNAIL